MEKKETKVPPLPVGISRKRFTDEEVYEIRRRILAGSTKAELAREYGCSSPTIADAAHGLDTYKDV